MAPVVRSALSSLNRYVPFPPFPPDAQAHVGLLLFVTAIPETTGVFGAVVSTVIVKLPDTDQLPTVSLSCTERVC